MMVSVTTLIRRASVILLVGVLACVTGLARQSGQRVINQASVEPGLQSPVEVISVSVRGGAVEPGRPFPAGDDWLAGFTLRVKNVSDRPVSVVDVRLRFPTPAGHKRKHVSLLGLLTYGCRAGYGCHPDASGSAGAIMPGETRDMVLTDEAHKRLGANLAQLGVPTPVEAAEYEIDSVFFDADTLWSRGNVLKRDPAEPNKYKWSERYALPKKPE